MRRWIGLLGFVVLGTGCSALDGGFSGGGEFGATQGGVQDLTFARDLVENGKVPPKDAILVEAMFSEHDLPVQGPPCAETLCLRGAVGVAPDAEGAPAAWAQIGLSSTIDPATFQRPPVAIIATVDVSGSMGWDYGAEEPAAIARSLLKEITGELTPQDRFAMVTYGNDVDVPIGWTYGMDPTIQQVIQGLHSDGSTNMEAGLQRAFSMAKELEGDPIDVRVVLFTDEQPNVGATSASEFEQMAKDAGEDGVGLTVMGLGLGLGAEVMKGMAHLRGGNAFSLTRTSEVSPFMEDNWPWFTIPVAYDLSVSAQPTAGLSLGAAYGIPETSAGQSASLDVATVFLSKRRGAMLLELTPALDHVLAAGDGVALDLSYTDPDGGAHDAALSPSYDGAAPDAAGLSMPQPGISRAVSLVLFTSGMRAAVEEYETDHAQAAADMESALDRLTADADATADADLATEAEFWAKLLDLMKSDAPQGSFYDEGY